MFSLKDCFKIATEVEFAVRVVAAASIAFLLMVLYAMWKNLAILPVAVAPTIQGQLPQRDKPHKFPQVTHETAR